MMAFAGPLCPHVCPPSPHEHYQSRALLAPVPRGNGRGTGPLFGEPPPPSTNKSGSCTNTHVPWTEVDNVSRARPCIWTLNSGTPARMLQMPGTTSRQRRPADLIVIVPGK